MPPRLFELLEAEPPQWVEILEASCDIDAVSYVHPVSSLTALHLAVMARDPAHSRARLGVIRSLLLSSLKPTEVKCEKHGYTPLAYACVATTIGDLEHDAAVVKVLLEHNSKAFRVRSNEGHTPLDVHILTMSRLQQRTRSEDRLPRSGSNHLKSKGSCTSVLKALVENDMGISIPRSLDLLLAFNSLHVMEHVTQEEARSSLVRLRDRRRQRAAASSGAIASSGAEQEQQPPVPARLPVQAGSRICQGFWVWEFVVTVLRAEHEHAYRAVKPVPPFNALHTASQIVGFPPAFAILCMRAYPSQLRTPSCVGDSGLPIHSVAGWEGNDDNGTQARKAITLAEMAHEHPTSCRYRNRQGKTPLSLALESGTSWQGGVRRLTLAQKQDSFVERLTPGVME
jgi:hypothetical protein